MWRLYRSSRRGSSKLRLSGEDSNRVLRSAWGWGVTPCPPQPTGLGPEARTTATLDPQGAATAAPTCRCPPADLRRDWRPRDGLPTPVRPQTLRRLGDAAVQASQGTSPFPPVAPFPTEGRGSTATLRSSTSLRSTSPGGAPALLPSCEQRAPRAATVSRPVYPCSAVGPLRGWALVVSQSRGSPAAHTV